MLSRIGKTTCPYCGVGCGVKIPLPEENDKTIAPVTGDELHPANFGRLCVKGSSLSETLNRPGRLLYPQVNGERANWDNAVEHISQRVRQITDQYGPDSFAFYLSGQILTEDYYVANKLAKGFIGTANVDTNSRLCMASAVAGYKRAFGSDTVPCSYEDLETCDLLIMIGSNAAWTHPVLFQRIVAAKEKRPQMKVVVIDPRRTATCDIADLHLAIQPGTDAIVFASLLVESVQRGIHDPAFVAEHTEGFTETYETALRHAGTVQEAARQCGVEESQWQQLLDWWCATEKTVSFYSQGINQSSSGTDKANAIINCHLVTGRIGREGMGPFSITGQPNAMGGREVGGLANQLAAHMDFQNPGAIELVQRFWQAPNMATENGLKAVDLFQAIEEGKVKALWIMSTNPMVSLPDTQQVKRALEKCEFVVVSDCQQQTDTTPFADVLLPATTWSEKDGTVTNSERRISRQRGLLPAPGEARHDWWAICAVAKAMGYQSAFSYHHPQEIFIEHAALSAFENNGRRDFDIGHLRFLNQAEYDALRPVQWPVPEGKPEGTKRLFADGQFFTPNRKARLIPVTPRKVAQQPTSDYPFVLNSGRIRDQWHTMTRTGKAPSLLRHTAQPTVDIAPSDALRLRIKEGGLVRLTSPLCQPENGLLLRAHIQSGQPSGQLFVPIHWTQQHASNAVVSQLIPQHTDPISGQPESKHGIANLQAVAQVTYGFVLARREVDLSAFEYWCDVTLEQGKRYEVALSGKTDPSQLIRQLAEAKGEWLEYHNPISGTARYAFLVGGQLHLVAYFSPQPTLPERDWLIGLFDSERTLSNRDRSALLVGRPANVEDKGAIVCSCFQVGEKQIQKAINGGCHSLESLSAKLKCGTNCGSCLPELKQYFPELEVSA